MKIDVQHDDGVKKRKGSVMRSELLRIRTLFEIDSAEGIEIAIDHLRFSDRSEVRKRGREVGRKGEEGG